MNIITIKKFKKEKNKNKNKKRNLKPTPGSRKIGLLFKSYW